MTQTPEGEEFQPEFRSKRRAAKVDYTEKKEDYDFEITKQPNKRSNSLTSSPVKETNGKKKRKSNNPNGRAGNASRSESPASLESDMDLNNPIPLNFQPDTKDWKFSNILNLEGAFVKNKLELVLKDGTSIKKNDNVYMICEPPGEPYYIGRIMGFVNKDKKQQFKNLESINEPAENCSFKINWWYRSRDISKHSTDSRLVYASMHSDICPIQSFRGKCLVKHKDEIQDLDSYKLKSNQFWFDKFFDRYMIKFYDVLPTNLLTSLPINYRTALNKRFQYIFLEQGKAKDMLHQPKSCVKCHQWSSSSDSIECCECGDIYHMLCLDPPLTKKPARGFAWSCIRCTKKIERKRLLENTGLQTKKEQKEDNAVLTANDEIKSPMLPSVGEAKKIPLYEELAISFLEKDRSLSFQQRRDSEEWIYRYLGMHAKLEDALDLQDRPYPRAASRLGPKNQLTGVQLGWFNHPVVYYDDSELNEDFQNRSHSHGTVGRKKKVDGRKKKSKNDNTDHEALFVPLKVPAEYQDVDPNEFPRWLQPRPKGYIERGGDDGRTSTLLWKNPTTLNDKTDPDEINEILDEYVKDCDYIAQDLGLLPTTPNFQDALLNNLFISKFNIEEAMKLNKSITKTTLKEPQFTSSEIKKFEAGIRKYGSELWPTFKEVKSQPFGMIVRFYYLWKKTPNGRSIWGNFADRRKFKSSSKVEEKNSENDIGNDQDDSSYDMGKIEKKEVCCKHCKTAETKQWYRSPGQQHPDDAKHIQYALCLRCARLWRRYAVIWEDPNEVYRKTSQKGGNGWKRKVEQELIIDSELILKARSEASTLTPEPSSQRSKKQSSEPLELASEEIEVEKKKRLEEPKRKRNIDDTKKKSKDEEPERKRKSKEDEPEKKKKTKLEEPVKKKVQKPKEEKPEPVDIQISSIINDAIGVNYSANTTLANSNLQTAINERYYQLNASHYTSHPKFKERPILRPKAFEPNHSLQPGNIEPCAVCFATSKKEGADLLRCSNCHMMVHPGCYGIDKDESFEKEPLVKYKWNCDCCSNSLNPVISKDYTCALCSSDISHGALKRTNDGDWVHVLCALLVKDVKFLDINSLQPALGVGKFQKRLIKNEDTKRTDILKCYECNKIWNYQDFYSGAIVEGDQKPETCIFGFRVVGLEADNKPDMKTIKINGLLGRIQACIRCSTHDASANFFDGTQLGKRYKQSTQIPLLRIFIEDNKRAEKTNISGNALRYKEYREMVALVEGNEEEDSNGGSVKKISSRKCTNCEVTDSLYWVNDKCYKCFMKEKNSSSETNEETTKAEEEDFDCSRYGFKNLHTKVMIPTEPELVYNFKAPEVLYDTDPFESWRKDFNPLIKFSECKLTLEQKRAVIESFGVLKSDIVEQLTDENISIEESIPVVSTSASQTITSESTPISSTPIKSTSFASTSVKYPSSVPVSSDTVSYANIPSMVEPLVLESTSVGSFTATPLASTSAIPKPLELSPVSIPVKPLVESAPIESISAIQIKPEGEPVKIPEPVPVKVEISSVVEEFMNTLPDADDTDEILPDASISEKDPEIKTEVLDPVDKDGDIVMNDEAKFEPGQSHKMSIGNILE